MTISMLRFGFPLAIVLATASAAAVAQEADQTANEAGEVQQTMVGFSYTGIPVERLQVERPVSYANLDLTTPSGAAELKRRVIETAKAACEQLDSADPIALSDTDDFSCVKTATDGALKQANAAIAAARTNSAS
jgi:UrcA family protein